jgi:hypothetical protein
MVTIYLIKIKFHLDAVVKVVRFFHKGKLGGK